MSPFADPWILDSLGIALTAVGGAGLIALFISQPLGPVMKRAVGVICAVMAVGGILLMVRAGSLRDSDRDLDPAQQAELAKALSRFPNVRFEVLMGHTGEETRSLASKVVDAVKAGTGAAPTIGATLPSQQKGVVLVLRDRETDLGRAVATTIGRVLMAARVAAITDDEPGLDDRTVRIIVGEKP
ncbi:hypothetical protein [Reyranella soli]|jgi:hypothetical protein|uniref:Uncharacterized protein n=1 Tax=Reyranella soli TaxID=1230389 RepID=A0A512NRS2_9HYPH|nr:hypothetical protein [Reyranella soli]GEP61612.1 hypothetical protein RSO01_87780 [Reyranella soli]